MNILLFILICYGISNIVCNEYIFIQWKEKIKNPFLRKLFNCSTCFGMYLGFIMFLLFNPFTFSGIYIIDSLLAGFLISGCNNILENIKIRFGS